MKHAHILFFAAISLVLLFPIFSNFSNWGLYDWDQHMFYHESARVSLLNYGQFPLWNAYYCGGNPLLANPQSGFLSPLFGFILLFGAVAGLKLQALVYLFLGLFGTYLVAKRMGARQVPSMLAAVIFMLSSWFAMRVLVGHTTFFSFALMPWVFYFYLKSLNQGKWLVGSALTLAIMFLAGGIYPFYATALMLGIYAFFTTVERKKMMPFAIVLAIFTLAFLLAAVKILPVLDFTNDVQVQKDTQLTSLGFVARALFNPTQDINKNDALTGRDNFPDGREKEIAILQGKVPWQWHEYSGYTGILAFLLALLALVNYKKNWKLLLLAVFFIILSFGDKSPIPLWQIMRNLPFLSGLHGPSRFIIPFVFVVALLAAKSLTNLKIPRRKYVEGGLLVIITLEMLFVSMPLIGDAFNVEPLKNLQTENEDFIQFQTPVPIASQYPNLLQNLGTVNCYERLHLVTRATPQFVNGVPNDRFIGNAYLAETNQSFDFSGFSPNKIVIDLTEANLSETATLVINQNFYTGWTASNGNVQSYNGLLAAQVSPSDKIVEFNFLPKSFVVGSIVSLLSLFFAIFAFAKPNFLRKLMFQPQS